jgi:hypothetical protein
MAQQFKNPTTALDLHKHANFTEKESIALKMHKRHNRTPHKAGFVRELLVAFDAVSGGAITP